MVTHHNLEIVRVASQEKQQDLLTLLHDISDVTALGSSTDGAHFVVFECPDRRLKIAIEKLFAVFERVTSPSISTAPLQPSGDGAA